MSEDLSVYLSGKKLYGDDFTIDQINEWFMDEEEGYADLGSKDKQSYKYVYHKLNILHGYRHLGNRHFENVLGIGSAYGEEFLPIIDKIRSVTILDPSEAFAGTKEIKGVPCKYLKPKPDGHLPFADNSFDLMTSLGVMHHIPNISTVMKECFRCLTPGGVMLIKEPIQSMGDWSKARRGLTKRERGIPLRIFDNIIISSGFKVKRRTLFQFPVVRRFAEKFGLDLYNSALLTFWDTFFSRVFSWNIVYHPTTIPERLGPSAVYYVLEKGVKAD